MVELLRFFSPDSLEALCTYSTVFSSFFRHVSIWVEMHMAVSFVLQCFRQAPIRKLQWALRLIWAPGLMLTLLSALKYPWSYDPVEGMCMPATWSNSADPLVLGDLALCLCVCVGSYVTILCRSWGQHSPGTVQRRASLRAGTYMVNAVLTYGPACACYVSRELFQIAGFLTFATTFEMLGGCFNSVTYATQSRYARVLSGESSIIRGNSGSTVVRPSFNVGFCPVAEMFEIDQPPDSS